MFYSINIGINGFGRIGKTCFYQLINDEHYFIKAININNLSIEDIEKYLNNDSIFGSSIFSVEMLDDNYILLNNQKIKIFQTKNANEINWDEVGVEYLIESTGAFLTTEKAKQHNSPYIIMSAPPKDIGITPLFCYGVNETNYNGENIISAASCTTNCIAPFLKVCSSYGLSNASFITIHSATSSQSVVDTANFNKRTNRSIFNNIIPHTTGASKSIDLILPDLKGKIIGTSVRVPTSNVSMIDLNVNFNDDINYLDFLNELKSYEGDVIKINKDNLVSSDFIGSSSPTIVDYNSTQQLHSKGIKFSLWYDNEYSYCANMLRLIKSMYEYNNNENMKSIEQINCNGKNVFMRVDYNVPINEKTKEITDTYRIDMSMKTLNKILYDKPNRLILATHFGRPKPGIFNEKYTTSILLDEIEKRISKRVIFLKNGLETKEEEYLSDSNIFLMENTRFHEYETNPSGDKFNLSIPIDIFVNEAFSCSHRKHTSMSYINSPIKCYGYQVYKEIDALNLIVKNKKSKILAIIGGNKIDDKIPMMESLSKKVDTIFVAGNNVNNLDKYKCFFNKIKNNKAEIIYAIDGIGNLTPLQDPIYSMSYLKNKMLWFDIGHFSLNNLIEECNKADIIFWNGTLGIVEDEFYKLGSVILYNYLNSLHNKKIIIGGGDTAGFVNQYKNNNFYHISTGGGASIEYIANSILFCEKV
ncbi:phosphoglycerate kinase [bacterium]|nr:phosphoglycerate kinase [bacterium]